MSKINFNVVRNHDFKDATAGLPDNWTSIAASNSTRHHLQRTDPPQHPERKVIQLPIQSDHYVWKSGVYRIKLTSGASAGDNLIQTHANSALAHPVKALQRWTVKTVARTDTVGSLARILVMGLDSAHAISHYLVTPDGGSYNQQRPQLEWTTAATNLDHPVGDGWTESGFSFVVPMGINSILIRVGNGSAGEHVLDFGEVRMEETKDNVTGGPV